MDWLFQGASGSKSLTGAAVQGAEHGLASALLLCVLLLEQLSVLLCCCAAASCRDQTWICVCSHSRSSACPGLSCLGGRWVPGMGPTWDGPWLIPGTETVTLCSDLGHGTVPWPWGWLCYPVTPRKPPVLAGEVTWGQRGWRAAGGKSPGGAVTVAGHPQVCPGRQEAPGLCQPWGVQQDQSSDHPCAGAPQILCPALGSSGRTLRG